MENLSDWPDHYESLRSRVRWFWLIGTGQIVATIALVLLIAQLSDRLAAVIFVASLLIYWIAFPLSGSGQTGSYEGKGVVSCRCSQPRMPR